MVPTVENSNLVIRIVTFFLKRSVHTKAFSPELVNLNVRKKYKGEKTLYPATWCNPVSCGKKWKAQCNNQHN